MFLGLQRRHMRGTIFGNLGLTNSIRALFCKDASIQPVPQDNYHHQCQYDI
jgi:hypothetical protein